jgi:ERCC4-related helicase
MTILHPFLPEIRLHVEGRIAAQDAARQERTAQEILKRLVDQPGVILADEVGMGKTFVALAVAVSVALNNPGRLPVVVMVPSGLKEKWPSDFSVFCEKCLPPEVAGKLKAGVADRATQFLKMLDDPIERRRSVIFLAHGAMQRGLNDKWVMLAVIYQSLLRRHGADELRHQLGRVMGELLRKGWIDKRDGGVWERLLRTHPSGWKRVLERSDIGNWAEEGDDPGDDPVPEAIWKVLPELDLSSVYESLHEIPKRMSASYHERVAKARGVIQGAIRELWGDCLRRTKLKLPLLILDEAHHLKNSETRLASLFHSEEAKEDAEAVTRGPLGGVFERMLFLTATPFQLGHAELCSVLDRFDGIDWSTSHAPTCTREGFREARQKMRAALDVAQEAAVTLDHAWGRLRTDDLHVGGVAYGDVASWWRAARGSAELSAAASDVVRCFERAKAKLKEAEREIRPYIIRHLKPRRLPGELTSIPRRERLVGSAILASPNDGERGIPVSGEALLPFLLAARAASQAPESRPVFAEGLASSYEAFLHTRRSREAVDGDDEDRKAAVRVTDSMTWYLDRLEELLPAGKADTSHPKVAATVGRVVDIWRRGEKVVVFCHYIATGRILRQRISEAILDEILKLGGSKLGCSRGEVAERLDAIGKRFFDQDSPLKRACDAMTRELVGQYPGLRDSTEDLVDIVRRNLRTPAFLVRFFPLERERLDEEAAEAALSTPDQSGLTLKALLNQLFSFLVGRCSQEERHRYLEAVKRIQTGTHFGLDAAEEYSDDELQGDAPERLLPNVRLVNGTTRPETRQRLMLTFNTPFYPEVLVASSVMAEGVDLHLNCRHVIHHDLCWNPSTLEQRTGRVDRIGAKAELSGHPIQVFLPYIAETQDEKMYRVVTDRERWFSVVMGEEYKVDARTTESLADRVPFPVEAAGELSFELGLVAALSRAEAQPAVGPRVIA